MAVQCLGQRRIPGIKSLNEELAANTQRNLSKKGVDWQFTTNNRINNPAAEQRGCCSKKVLDSGLIPLKTPQRLPRVASSWVLNPRHE